MTSMFFNCTKSSTCAINVTKKIFTYPFYSLIGILLVITVAPHTTNKKRHSWPKHFAYVAWYVRGHRCTAVGASASGCASLFLEESHRRMLYCHVAGRLQRQASCWAIPPYALPSNKATIGEYEEWKALIEPWP
jgi:hypothetical protein